MSNEFELLSEIAQNEFGVTIKSKHSTGETFDSLYGETKDCKKREKQIEEIAKVMCGGCPDNKECMRCLCADWYKAEDLYNAGYRNQSEVAMEIFEEIYKLTYRLSNDEHYTIGDMIWDIDELKKKYTDINQRKEDESNGVHI